MFFYEQGLSSLHLHKLYDKFMDVIFGCFNYPQLVNDIQETYLRICLLNIVWKPRDVFLVDVISRLKCLYTIQADANLVKLEKTKVWQEEEKETEKKQKRYYQEHKEELAEKRKVEIQCEVCKCTVRKCGWVRHQKTQKHKDNLEKQEEEKVEQ